MRIPLVSLPPVHGRPNRIWVSSARSLRPVFLGLTRRDWGPERVVPTDGGVIIALNHLSEIDPLLTTHWMWEHQGRVPSFLAKASLFENRWVGWWFRGTDHVRVDRTSGGDAVGPAVEAVREGKAILVYVEGTITRDPDGWPMVPRSGAARIALESGVPVIPVAQWGAQDLLPAYTGKFRLRRRTAVAFRAGEAVDLSDLLGLHDDVDAVQEASERIMAAIVAELEEIRHEKAPARRFDPVAEGFTRYGRPR